MAVSTSSQTQPNTPLKAEFDDVARGIIQSLIDARIELTISGTNYQIHLTPAVPVAQIAVAVGKRITGRIHGKALRIFKAHGGGRFIEPIWGEPRIVAGIVQAVDEPNRRILVDVAVPMWLTLAERQPADMFKVGDLVNCYVESGTRFEPAI